MRSTIVVISVVVLFLGSVSAHATVPYTITDLGTLGGSTVEASGVNASGQVVGYGYTTGDANQHAFFYSGSTMTDLGIFGGTTSCAYGINDSGCVVGYAWTTRNANQHAFLYNGSTMTDLGTLGGGYSIAYGINASGQVVGWASNTNDAAWHAFLYSGTKMTDLGTLSGGQSYAYGINASGQVVGNSWTTGSNNSHAFLYSGTKMTDLDTLGGAQSYAYGINAGGQVVGISWTTGSNNSHAFLYSGSTMIDLNSLIDQSSGWTLFGAEGINDSVQICGYGSIGGQSHAFLLTPIPDPSTLALLVMGGIGLIAYGWRRRCLQRLSRLAECVPVFPSKLRQHVRAAAMQVQPCRKCSLGRSSIVVVVFVFTTTTTAWAANITYKIIDYPANEADELTPGTDMISGTIITDGTLGPWSSNHVVGGTLKFTCPNQTREASFVTTYSYEAEMLYATSTQLLLPAGDYIELVYWTPNGQTRLDLAYCRSTKVEWNYFFGQSNTDITTLGCFEQTSPSAVTRINEPHEDSTLKGVLGVICNEIILGWGTLFAIIGSWLCTFFALMVLVAPEKYGLTWKQAFTIFSSVALTCYFALWGGRRLVDWIEERYKPSDLKKPK